jgi:hypothetical protein
VRSITTRLGVVCVTRRHAHDEDDTLVVDQCPIRRRPRCLWCACTRICCQSLPCPRQAVVALVTHHHVSLAPAAAARRCVLPSVQDVWMIHLCQTHATAAFRPCLVAHASFANRRRITRACRSCHPLSSLAAALRTPLPPCTVVASRTPLPASATTRTHTASTIRGHITRCSAIRCHSTLTTPAIRCPSAAAPRTTLPPSAAIPHAVIAVDRRLVPQASLATRHATHAATIHRRCITRACRSCQTPRYHARHSRRPPQRTHCSRGLAPSRHSHPLPHYARRHHPPPLHHAHMLLLHPSAAALHARRSRHPPRDIRCSREMLWPHAQSPLQPSAATSWTLPLPQSTAPRTPLQPSAPSRTPQPLTGVASLRVLQPPASASLPPSGATSHTGIRTPLHHSPLQSSAPASRAHAASSISRRTAHIDPAIRHITLTRR